MGHCAGRKHAGLRIMNRRSTNLVIRVDGHKAIGMGHLYRMVTLSRYLRHQHGLEISFIVRNNRAALTLVQRHRFRTHPLEFSISRENELAKVTSVLSSEKPQVVIVDLRNRCHDQSFMKSIKSASNACIIAFTDVHEKQEVQADIVINGSILQDQESYKDILGTKYYLGFDYVVLSPGYLAIESGPKAGDQVERVMICMGGADQHNLTFTVLKAIDKSAHNFVCDVVLSSAFFKRETVDDVVKILRHETTVYYDTDGILDLLLQADLAITAGGNAHVERMCAGVPGIAISQELHQAASVREIAGFGATVDLGLFKDLGPRRLLEAFNKLIEDTGSRERMSKCGRLLVDGKGLIRVSDIIARECKGSSKIVRQ